MFHDSSCVCASQRREALNSALVVGEGGVSGRRGHGIKVKLAGNGGERRLWRVGAGPSGGGSSSTRISW